MRREAVLRQPIEADEPAENLETRMQEHVRVFHDRYQKRMIEMAAAARDKAVSHREKPFHVGSAVLAVSQADVYDVYASHNWTPTPLGRHGKKREDGDKRCAERNSLDGAMLADPNTLIAAIVTVSRETSTGDEMAHDVLHPCPDCRTLLRQLVAQGNLREDSVICSVNDTSHEGHGVKPIVEETTIGELLSHYRNDVSVRSNVLPYEKIAS